MAKPIPVIHPPVVALSPISQIQAQLHQNSGTLISKPLYSYLLQHMGLSKKTSKNNCPLH